MYLIVACTYVYVRCIDVGVAAISPPIYGLQHHQIIVICNMVEIIPLLHYIYTQTLIHTLQSHSETLESL